MSGARDPNIHRARRAVGAVAVLGLALALAGCSVERDPGAGPTAGAADSAALAARAAAIELRPVTAGQVLAEVRDRAAPATVVNVWASWCAPCREEFPDLVRLERAYRDRGFRLVFVSVDFDEDVAHARRFLAEQGVEGPTYIKDEDDMQFINTLDPDWSGALPGSFLYDDTGRLRRFWEGKASYEVLEERLLSILDPNG